MTSYERLPLWESLYVSRREITALRMACAIVNLWLTFRPAARMLWAAEAPPSSPLAGPSPGKRFGMRHIEAFGVLVEEASVNISTVRCGRPVFLCLFRPAASAAVAFL